MRHAVFGESVQGSSHKRSGIECQDSYRKIEYDDGTVIMAVADGHGSKSCPYSKTGSSIAVNVFCKVMAEFHSSYADNIDMLLTYLNREGDTKVAQAIDSEWKRRVLKVHANKKREVLYSNSGEIDKQEIFTQYGSTLVGLMITPSFLFAFQLGDGDVSYVDDKGFDQIIQSVKILGIETYSLSKIDAWKRVLTVVRRRSNTDDIPCAFLMSTDGLSNSYKSEDEFKKSCSDYYETLKRHGTDTVMANLENWLSETSELGCGDDITLLIAYYSCDDASLNKISLIDDKLSPLSENEGNADEQTQ